MNITIQGRTVVYVSDYSPTHPAWKIQNLDAHRLVFVAGTECFVKRFERRLPAWDFLFAIRGQRHPGLALIHDAQSTAEGGRTVYYLFLEKIEGELLHDLIRQGGTANGPALGRAMASAFRVLRTQGYWHTDFCTKNIMVTTADKQFVLIDLDSLEPATTPPSAARNQPGYIPDQELAVYALNYVRAYAQPATKTLAAFPGPALNLIQLIFLLDKLVYFAVSLKPQGAKFGQMEHFKKLPALVHTHLAPYTDRLVKDILANRPVADELILSQGSNFQAQLQAGSKLATPAPSVARIIHLRASKPTLKPGEATVISWETVGASFASLTYYATVATSGALTLTYEQLAKFSGRKEGRIELTLSLGQQGQTQAVSVELKPASVVNYPSVQTAKQLVAPIAPPPAISFFQASKDSLRPGETTIISWQTTGGATSALLTYFPTVAASGSLTLSFERLAQLSGKTQGLVELMLSVGYLATVHKSVSIELIPNQTILLPAITSFRASTNKVPLGGHVLLSWETTNATTLKLSFYPHGRNGLTFYDNFRQVSGASGAIKITYDEIKRIENSKFSCFELVVMNAMGSKSILQQVSLELPAPDFLVRQAMLDWYPPVVPAPPPPKMGRFRLGFSSILYKIADVWEWCFGDWKKLPLNDNYASRFGCVFIYIPMLILMLFGLVTTCARG